MGMLRGVYRNLVKPLLFSLDAETAHHLTLRGLERASALGGLEELRAVSSSTEPWPGKCLSVAAISATCMPST